MHLPAMFGYAFSKGEKSYPGFCDIDRFVSFGFICCSLYKIKLKTKENTMITFYSEYFLNVQCFVDLDSVCWLKKDYIDFYILVACPKLSSPFPATCFAFPLFIYSYLQKILKLKFPL